MEPSRRQAQPTTSAERCRWQRSSSRARRRAPLAVAACSLATAAALCAAGRSLAWSPLASSGRSRLASTSRRAWYTAVAEETTRQEEAEDRPPPAHELLKHGSLNLRDYELKLREVPDDSLFYVPDFITPEEEEIVKKEVDQAGLGGRWTKCLNRRMQSFGAPGALPPFLERLAEGMQSCGAVPSKFYPNHCLVNDYMFGNGIGAHSDPDYFGHHVAIFSLLEPTAIYFARTTPYSIVQPRHRVILAPRSMLVFSGEMYSNWTHEIPELNRESVEDVDWEGAGVEAPRLRRRVSLTLRRWM